MPFSPVEGSAWADGAGLHFRFADAGHALAGVRLLQDVRIPAQQLEFGRTPAGWELELTAPPVARLEYLLELRYPDGGTKVSTDPGNPRQAPGAFGPRSVLEHPGYAPPAWLSAPAGRGGSQAFELPVLDDVMSVRVWSPAGSRAADRLPLLVVHDGPEYDSLASLTRYLGAGIQAGWLPALRAALLSPGPRNSWYSANARYARALRQSVLSLLTGRLTVSRRIGMGTSLGALAMLHAYCRYPDSFDAPVPAVRQLLHPGPGQPGTPVPALPADHRLHRGRARRRLAGQARPGRADLRRGGGKRRQQPADGADPARARLPG